jgi:uncharacterized protein with HEPN domain
MSRSPLEYVQHILDETEYLVKHAVGLSKEKFIQDDTLRRAFVRSIEIIGEATKNIPDEFKQKYAQIDWRPMASMRDRLIHGYFGVDYDIVWDVVINEIPILRQEVEKILLIERNRPDAPTTPH